MRRSERFSPGFALVFDGIWIRGGALWAFRGRAPITQHAVGARSHEFSLWFGTALVVVGVVVNLRCTHRYVRLVDELNRGQCMPRSLSKEGLVVALFLAPFGVAMAIYVVVMTQPLVAH